MKIVIEVTKGSTMKEPVDAYDQIRIGYLEAEGYYVLRIAEEEARDHSQAITSAIKDCISRSNSPN
jgi:very-short-patch-repair endonuclease